MGFLPRQGKRRPAGEPRMVALGSSFAAGIGLGPRVAGSARICQRTINSYPQQLSRLLNLPLVDMTCSGATVAQVLRGGQLFQGAQVDGIGPDTELVTLTAGGNDVGYVGDLSLLAARRAQGFTGWAARCFTKMPDLLRQRPWSELQADLAETLGQIHARAPQARLVVATYPAILPPHGTCHRLNLTDAEASAMREVGDRLAEVTRKAAREAGAIVVDMHRLGAGHHACSAEPWSNGWNDRQGTPFHPTLAGAKATAAAIALALQG